MARRRGLFQGGLRGFCPEIVIRAAGWGGEEGVSPSTVSSHAVLASRILPSHLLRVAAPRPPWRPQSQSQGNARACPLQGSASQP